MKEWIRKDEVLDIIRSMPRDMVEEYILELKGIWADEDFNQWNSLDDDTNIPKAGDDYLLKVRGTNNIEFVIIGFCDSIYDWMESRECIPIDRKDIVGWMPIPE